MAWIKKAYLYIVSIITLVIMIIAAIGLINMGFKAALGVSDYSYSVPYCESMKPVEGSMARECTAEEQAKQEEREHKNQAENRKRDIAQFLAMLIVAAPVFYYHWGLARKEQ
jgi:hypothetical protein